MSKKALLVICDGWGIGNHSKADVIYNTPTPYWDSLVKDYPVSQLLASGENVGLPDGQMGNSEVGHLNIGAGRVVYQDLVKINIACRENKIQQNPEIVKAYSYAKENNKNIHFLGLVSDGGVHSSLEHLFKLTEIAKEYGISKSYVHCFMDGRDVSPTSGKGYIEALQAKISELGIGKIASVMGRYYAMDREMRWERVEKAYAAMVYAEGVSVSDPVQGMQASYDEGITDEFIVPTVVVGGGKMSAGDSVICFNFRPDRAREITRTIVDDAFDGFQRRTGRLQIQYVCMTPYDKTMPNVSVAFLPQSMENTLGGYLSEKGLTQLRIAEYTKYAHVTFFFNAGTETVYPGEDRKLIDTANVATFDLKPEMSAYEVTAEVISRIESGKYDLIVLNFANCDMVGHTGVFDAAVKAVKTVDECVGRVVKAVQAAGGVSLVTADHGNADKMYYDDGSPFTAHTTNPVPVILVGHPCELRQSGGCLGDIAPTLLDIMGLPQPVEMTGKTLIIH